MSRIAVPSIYVQPPSLKRKANVFQGKLKAVWENEGVGMDFKNLRVPLIKSWLRLLSES